MLRHVEIVFRVGSQGYAGRKPDHWSRVIPSPTPLLQSRGFSVPPAPILRGFLLRQTSPCKAVFHIRHSGQRIHVRESN